ncbi:SDR family NAD(P)-dependent oxidoreductase [Mycobacterium marinum]|uniref:Short-chain type dehydrogenase/reductase n=1 Tax=Mycobacterium marinum (strain ATCC BAA-535 / M) TaxID=216594 RepID=B2HLM8_MYCMM|nr:SDR family NAD(P)-dependent oxidoreductase [Mycobacterium marinum]ACC38777.1 short-chain type dehydrogenase/reductase [Mycobacterium marinum M]MDC8971729.1 SDR family NAD(P)-dependent oxidoreductase [Mycobacterium marinum]MDC8983007.1 SDR family NAD(P)-dependent oxidoreductase [Mycobacterium marinum]MDC8994023.1 SDR family NAD(P)-dependent oxidoreductase [Mycobacterium marinum]MDC8999632.1 SDR family NAD(P)-dependent oxidoreductase [Mycobacterium marinum]
MTELRFDDRVAVVTGAGRGLGRAYALLLAARGAKVVVNDTGGSLAGAGGDPAPAHQVVAEITALGGQAAASLDSVTTPAGGQAIIETALERYGRIDILIHNAGNVRSAPLKEMSYEDFDAVIDVHLRGAFHVVRPAFGLMCDQLYGRIVLASSIGGLYGNQGVANYAAAKAGLIGLSNVAAVEGAASGVLCNVIVPSAVTRMADGLDISSYPPMGTELVAPVVGLLAHESCPVNGEMLIAIAGRVARAVVAESPGVQRLSWSMEDVAEGLYAIRDLAAPLVFPVVPSGHSDHIRYSFESAAWANRGSAHHV